MADEPAFGGAKSDRGIEPWSEILLQETNFCLYLSGGKKINQMIY